MVDLNCSTPQGKQFVVIQIVEEQNETVVVIILGAHE